MRLGDLDALLDKFLRAYTEQEKVGNFQFVACEIKQGFADMVCEAPTIDAVPVVRCRDCNRGHLKHMRGDPCIECQLFHHEDPRQYKDLMDYCSHGVRKDGD